jgi:hypothetical protein
MSIRIKRWLLLLTVFTALIAGAFLFWPGPNWITEENARRVRVGMNRSEVEAILGPPGDYRTVKTRAAPMILPMNTYGGDAPIEEGRLHWRTNELLIKVILDKSGKVEDWFAIPQEPIEGSSLSNYSWWLKRKWWEWFGKGRKA